MKCKYCGKTIKIKDVHYPQQWTHSRIPECFVGHIAEPIKGRRRRGRIDKKEK